MAWNFEKVKCRFENIKSAFILNMEDKTYEMFDFSGGLCNSSVPFDRKFSETLAFAESVGFSKINVFPFSPRRGTVAWDMPDPVDPAVKKERCRRLLDLSARLERSFRASYVGKTVEVLFESEKNGQFSGCASNFLNVTVRSNICLTGKILPGLISDVGETSCRGDLQNPEKYGII